LTFVAPDISVVIPAAPDISVVIPAHNEAPSLQLIAGRIRDVLEREGRSYEIVFVDDGSGDGSRVILEQLRAEDSRVRVEYLGSHQGKSAALASGFAAAKGATLVTMDADLQDLPEELPILIGALEEQGLDLVQAWRSRRDDPKHKVLASHLFNSCCSLCSGLPLADINCGFKAMRAEVAKRLLLEPNMHRFIPIFVHRAGGRVAEVPVRHARRAFGRSKYGPMRYVLGLLGLFRVVLLPRLLRKTQPSKRIAVRDSEAHPGVRESLG
jgi:glycosyltransferase involved in cell wall biosynthesis